MGFGVLDFKKKNLNNWEWEDWLKLLAIWRVIGSFLRIGIEDCGGLIRIVGFPPNLFMGVWTMLPILPILSRAFVLEGFCQKLTFSSELPFWIKFLLSIISRINGGIWLIDACYVLWIKSLLVTC